MRSERAPEAGSRRRSRGKRWRALRGTCRGKALRVGKVASFDERAMEAILVLRAQTANAGRARRARGSVRGRSPVRHAVENAAVGQPVRTGSAPPNFGGPEVDSTEALGVPSSTPRLEVRSAERRAGASGRATRDRLARAVKAAGSGVERSTSARFVSRLQKSVRSIFPSRRGKAERPDEPETGSASRRSLLTRGPVRGGRYGCRAIPARTSK